ncbi:MAG TPA: translation elongation factor Ts [Firmicutes bacterium]|nr:translation elongation factor Ts [Candidatus Fermentithermobacillaceae bacterium]
MAEITVEKIRELRERTGAGMMDCKKALQETGGDMEKAIDYLRKKGLAQAAKKATRAAEQGVVEAYLHHNGRVGVLVELRCESDFVARTDVFKELAREIAMHIAWAKPDYISKEDVPKDILEREENVEKERARAEGKPEAVLDKIIQGRLAKFYERVCLLEQPFIRDDSKKVRDVIAEKVAVLGENIVVGNFARLALGE